MTLQAAVGPLPEFAIFIRDKNLNRVGQVDDYSDLGMVLRYNAVSSWRLVIPVTSPIVPLLVRGAGVIVERPRLGKTLLSGPIERFERRWDRDNDDIIINGVDDLVWVNDRVASPAPALTGPPYNTQAYDVRSGAAETVIRAYVEANLGTTAVSTRKAAGWAATANTALGSTVTGRARFQNLLVLCQKLALSGGDIGFRVVQTGTTIGLVFFTPANKTAVAVFSRDRGNLHTFDFYYGAPNVNVVTVGGGGVGTARTFVERSAPSSIVAWNRRVERFLDQRSTTDTAELAQAGDEELETEQEVRGLRMTPIDIEGLVFGVDYDLGDEVTVDVDGVPIAEIVREVELNITPDGTDVQPVLGSPDGTQRRSVHERLWNKVARLGAQVRNLETQ